MDQLNTFTSHNEFASLRRSNLIAVTNVLGLHRLLLQGPMPLWVGHFASKTSAILLARLTH